VGTALWQVWSEADAAREQTPHHVGQIVHRPMRDMPKEHRALIASGEGHRVVGAIKRRDENNAVYDLTREFIAEALFFPLAPKDDLIDAVSRIYDIGAARPVSYERAELEPRSFPDT
jgi:hypothetical protein